MADISLTASMRTNLLSLQNTQSLMDQTQERLSSGLKVNSAIDNASSYYTAQSLNNRASDLGALLDSMGQGVQTIKAANEGIEAITDFVTQAKAIANSARDSAAKTDPKSFEGPAEKLAAESSLSIAVKDAAGNAVTGDAATAVTAFNDKLKAATLTANLSKADYITAVKAAITAGGDALKKVVDVSIDETSGKVSFTAIGGYDATMTGTGDFATIGGTGVDTLNSKVEVNTDREKYAAQYDEILNQIDKLAKDSGYKGINLLQSNTLTVIFNEDRSSSIEVKGTDASTEGLKMSAAAGGWQSDADIDAAITQAEKAVSELRIMASDFGNYYSIVENRQDFTKNLINVLTEGADNLTLADMNEESANMLALQTRQQLAVNSLSLASQAAQGVLKLF